MKDIEVEIQLELENSEPLLDFLEKNGKLVYEDKQNDHYYTPKHRDFRDKKPIEEWLRLRDSNGKFSITYKNWHRDENRKTVHCDEYETTIGDIKQLENILKVLDFETVVKVQKNRKAYMYNDYEIALDEVENLGDFVEIEYKGKEDGDPKEIIQGMIKFLKDLKVGRIRRNNVGYAYKLLYPEDDHLNEIL